MAKDKEDRVVRCKVVETAGIKFWYPLSKSDAEAIFMVDTTVTPHVKADLRKQPLFLTILPCPYCGVEEDRGHKPLDHVDPRFGTPIDGGPIHNYIEDAQEPWSPYGRHDGLQVVSEADMEYLRGEPVPLVITIPNIKIEG
jgi:hypothetical protein